MDEILGFLQHSGFSGFNSVLLVILFFLLKGKFVALQEKVETLWEYHLKEIGWKQGRYDRDE